MEERMANRQFLWNTLILFQTLGGGRHLIGSRVHSSAPLL